jgi:NTE family protein
MPEPIPDLPARRVALVIGSGGIKCSAALGLWRVLQREGIEVDFAVGCSGGSIYATLMALGYSLDECERMTSELWTREVMAKRDTRSLFSALLPKVFKFDGDIAMVDDRPMREKLTLAVGDRTFADTEIPLHIVATDFRTGECVVMSEGSLFDAVRASASVPMVWKPWTVDGRQLVDGCLSDPMPVDVAIREGADVILSMGFETTLPRRVNTGVRFAYQVTGVYTNNLFKANFSFHNLAHHAEIIPVIPDMQEHVGLLSTDKIPYCIEEGERAAEEVMPYLRSVLSRPLPA